MNDPLPIKIST